MINMKMETKNKEKKTAGQKIKAGCTAMLVKMLMALVAVAIDAAVIAVGVCEIGSFMEPTTAMILGIVLNIIYAIVIFSSKYLRKMFYLKLLAIGGLIAAGWWVYVLID